MGLYLVGEIFDRRSEILAIPCQDAVAFRRVRARGLRIGVGHVRIFQQGLFASAGPRLTGDGLVRRPELIEQATAVQITLELGNVRLLAIVAAHFVEDFLEHRKQRVDLLLRYHIGFLVDVEQDALRRDRDSLSQIGCENLIMSALLLEKLVGRASAHVPVLQKERQDFQQVRFSRTEEAGNPDAVGRLIIVVGIEKSFELPLDLVGDDVFLELDPKAGLVIRLDDPFDRAIDGFLENVAKLGHAPLRSRSALCRTPGSICRRAGSQTDRAMLQ